MLGAYLDESFDGGNRGYFAVAGILGDGWRVMKAESHWRDLLKKYQMPKFKSSRMSRNPLIAAEFATAIRDAKLVAFGYIAEQKMVKKHLRGSRLHKQYQESPYMLLYQTSFVAAVQRLQSRGYMGSVSYVCDANARYLPIMSRSYPELRRINRECGPYMGSCSLDTDENCIPLQMADLVAGELRKKAPTWTPDSTEFSETLNVLLESGCLCWVGLLDDPVLESIRKLVNTKHGAAQRHDGRSPGLQAGENSRQICGL